MRILPGPRDLNKPRPCHGSIGIVLLISPGFVTKTFFLLMSPSLKSCDGYVKDSEATGTPR
ncbi:hypothetical protein B0T21DRAFT_366575 [Apiosordaria backusii]|uniref:Uncharacterized protein n=1 Tax=Apiosordaria backusii TaxID=314023 RepID=A0AA40ECB8_9PEZI|nr:hypothetical protein B0T21DRAFT_366575 [Apiosordaria backusii]